MKIKWTYNKLEAAYYVVYVLDALFFIFCAFHFSAWWFIPAILNFYLVYRFDAWYWETFIKIRDQHENS